MLLHISSNRRVLKALNLMSLKLDLMPLLPNYQVLFKRVLKVAVARANQWIMLNIHFACSSSSLIFVWKLNINPCVLGAPHAPNIFFSILRKDFRSNCFKEWTCHLQDIFTFPFLVPYNTEILLWSLLSENTSWKQVIRNLSLHCWTHQVERERWEIQLFHKKRVP